MTNHTNQKEHNMKTDRKNEDEDDKDFINTVLYKWMAKRRHFPLWAKSGDELYCEICGRLIPEDELFGDGLLPGTNQIACRNCIEKDEEEYKNFRQGLSHNGHATDPDPRL